MTIEWVVLCLGAPVLESDRHAVANIARSIGCQSLPATADNLTVVMRLDGWREGPVPVVLELFTPGHADVIWQHRNPAAVFASDVVVFPMGDSLTLPRTGTYVLSGAVGKSALVVTLQVRLASAPASPPVR